MAQKLKLEVVLQALDRATKPIRAITQGSVGLGRELKTTRDQLKQLQAQQRDVRSYRVATVAAAQQTRAIRDLATKSRGYSQALEQQRTVHQNLRGNLKSAQTQYNKLARALIDGKGNTAEFQRELEKATIRLTSARQAFERSSGSIKQYQTRLRNADHKLEDLNRNHKASQDQLVAVKQRLEQAGISTNNLGNQERALRQRIDGTNTQLQEQERRLKAVTTQQQRLARAKQQYQRTQAMTGAMAGTGAGGLATGSAMLYSGARLLAPGIEFGSQMSELQAVARLDRDSQEFQALRTQAKDLGATTAFTASEVGAGQTFLARAGFTPEAIQASMRDVLSLALANNTDLARTADIASNISSAFKIDPEVEGNITRVADVLSGTAARANVDLEMLGDTMKYLGGKSDLGLTLEQAATMAGLLGNIGIQGSQAGTTTRALVNRLTAPAKAGREAMEELGLQVANAQGGMRELPDILRDINNATRDMGSVQRQDILTRIFGVEAGSGSAELVSQMAGGNLDAFLAELHHLQGENQRMADVIADNMGGDLKNLSSAWDNIGLTIQEQNDGPLRAWVQSWTALLRGVADWIKDNPELTAAIFKTAAGLGMLIAAGGALTVTLASILGPFAMIRLGLSLFGVKAMGLLPILKAVGTAFMWLGRALLLNPIGLAITLLVTAGWLLYKNWDGVIGGLKALWADLGRGAKAIWAEITTAFDGGILGVGQLIANWSPLGMFYKAFAAVMSWFGVELPGNLIDGLVAGLKRLAPGLVSALSKIASMLPASVKRVLGIHSPSRVFAELGGFTMQGLAQGIQRQQGEPLAAVAGVSQRMASAAGGIRFDSRRPLSARPAYAGSTGSRYEIHIHAAAGMSPQAIAHAVAAELDRRERAAGARARSSLYDQE